MSTIEFKPATDFPDPKALLPDALPWIAAAGNPFFNVLFGGKEATASTLSSWILRPSSEVSILRAHFLMYDGQIAGGAICLGGAELRNARKADSVALLMHARPDERHALTDRLANFAGLFANVPEDEFYGSKMGVAPQFRGKHLGEVIQNYYLQWGTRLGFNKFSFDVRADNDAALRIYKSSGFEITGLTESKDKTLRYYTMRWQRSAS